MFRRSGRGSRLEAVAAGWGGVVAAIGLMVGVGRDWPVRLVLVGLGFLVGGFLAGVRAGSNRMRHALAAAVAGFLLYAAFVTLAWVAHAIGSAPEPPDLVPGGAGEPLVTAAWAVLAALVGGAAAQAALRPSGSSRLGR